MRLNFPHQKIRPELTEPPRTKPEVRDAYLEEMRRFLDTQMSVVRQELNFPGDVG